MEEEEEEEAAAGDGVETEEAVDEEAAADETEWRDKEEEREMISTICEWDRLPQMVDSLLSSCESSLMTGM